MSEHRRGSSRRSTTSRTSSSQRSPAGFGFGSATEQQSGSWLVTVADVSLLGILWLVTGWFGGRTPVGQFLLILLAGVAAGAWCWSQARSQDRGWVRTRCLLLWVGALSIPVLQLIALTPEWRDGISPELMQLFPVWTSSTTSAALKHGEWATLSLSPGDTFLAIPVLCAYGLVFLTGMQRMQTERDVEMVLRWVGIAAAFWASVGILQFLFHNGKMLWVIETAAPLSQRIVGGPFTNRNHFAQFLSLGVGPLVWCVYRASTARQNASSSSKSFGETSGFDWEPLAWGGALLVTVVAVLMSLSRGGGLALICSLGLPLLVILRRGGTRQSWLVMALGVVILATGSLGLDQLAGRFSDLDDSGRFPIWEANWKVAQDFPWLGTGVGTHMNAHYLHLSQPPVNREYTHAESSFLQIASETGFIGLTLAIVCSLWMLSAPARLAFTDGETQRAVAGAAILGALLGNVAHAVADFIWYVPAIVVSGLLLAACGRRLCDLALSRPDQIRSLAPWAWYGRAGIVVTATLMGMMVLFPEAVTESEIRNYQRLSWVGGGVARDLPPEEQEYYLLNKSRAAIAVARQSPLDCRLQAAAARACLRLFDISQRQSDSPMTLLELKDAALSAGFSTPQETRDWIKRVVGPRWKYLEAGRKFAVRSLGASPLEASAYVVLSELAFLDDPTGGLESEWLAQGLRLRPHDGHLHYVAGEISLLKGDIPTTIDHWKISFRWEPDYRVRICNMLAHVTTAEELIEQLELDWGTSTHAVYAFQAAGKEDDLRQVREHQVRCALSEARSSNDTKIKVLAWQTAADVLVSMEKWDEALATLNEAVERIPQDLGSRHRLAMLLVKTGRINEAIPHLKWVSARAPDDKAIARALESATDQQLRNPLELSLERDASRG